MNAVFSAVFLAACLLFLVNDPNAFLPAMLKGAEKAALLALSLLTVYCVWLGFFKVLEVSGLSEKLSRRVRPLAKKLFRSDDGIALGLASSNLSANMLGLPGAPTPLGIRATEAFLRKNNGHAADMLFVLNATSLQILPTTVIALRLAAGSASPADIFLPTLLTTLFTTLSGVLLLLLSEKFRRPHRRHGIGQSRLSFKRSMRT